MRNDITFTLSSRDRQRLEAVVSDRNALRSMSGGRVSSC
jgi:hypothetical protein